MPHNWQKPVKTYWVKKQITAKEWKNFYSYNPSYHKIGVEGVGRTKRVIIAFCVANEIPVDCEPLNEQELLEVYAQRQSTNTRPLPLLQRSEEQNKQQKYESIKQYTFSY